MDIAETMKIWLQIYDEDVKIEKGKVSNIVWIQDARYSDHKNSFKSVTIFSFDIDTNICIGARKYEEGYSEAENLIRYQDFKRLENTSPNNSPVTNVALKNGKIIYSDNLWIGKSKEEILKELQNLEYYEF